MDTATLLDRCGDIIKRQDLDRALLLFFMNSMRRTIFRDQRINKFCEYRTNVSYIDGIVTFTDLKSPLRVEFELDGIVSYLQRLYSVDELSNYSSSIVVLGTPKLYYTEGQNIIVVPAPAEGQINVFGEFWPADLTDSVSSSDITTVEIPEILIYLACAEYFDMLQENGQAQYWRQKGNSMLQNYLRQVRIAETNGIDLMARDPFGNCGPAVGYVDAIIDRLDGGTFI